MSSFTAARLVPAWPPYWAVRGEDGYGFWFYVGHPAADIGVFVPEGFLTDGPSLPRWLRRMLPRKLLRWVRRCLAKAAIIHDRMREDLQFELEDCDAYFLIAMTADLPSWPGPRWARIALREAAFLAVRTNTSRIKHNA